MKRVGLALVGVLLVGMLTPGCTSSQTWAEFSKSGGIANVKLSVVIDKAGKVTTTSAGATKTSELTAVQKEALTALLTAKPSAPSPSSSAVRDAFVYELRSDALRVSWNDADETPQLTEAREFFEGVAGV